MLVAATVLLVMLVAATVSYLSCWWLPLPYLSCLVYVVSVFWWSLARKCDLGYV
jgi:hypothetical protein